MSTRSLTSQTTQEDVFPATLSFTHTRSLDLAPQMSNTSSLGLKPQLSRTFSRPREGEVYFAAGRGGAGNIIKALQLPSPQLVPVGSHTPTISLAVYTTGRGGRGNMFPNEDPKLTRKAQDVEEDSMSPVASQTPITERHFATGRGGFGNRVTPTKSNIALSPRNTDPSVQVAPVAATAPRKSGFMGKVKGLFSA